MGIAENLSSIRERMRNACLRAGRREDSVLLIAVSKAQPIEKILEAAHEGQADFGENYVQELLVKSQKSQVPQQDFRPLTLDMRLQWHFIGHLQRNKVRHVVGQVTLIHSLDSIPLAEEVEKRAEAAGIVQRVLIELNLAGESSKSGLASEDLPALVERLNLLSHLRLEGLMTVPPHTDDPEGARPYFSALRKIRDEINAGTTYKTRLTELSMGMTHDFETAVEEGSTMVRIGTAVFGART